MTWEAIWKVFDKRYHVTTKHTTFSRLLKALSFHQFTNEEATDDVSFKKLVAYIERLSRLADDGDQTDDGLFDVIWKSGEGELWALHAKTKDGIKFVFSKSVEVLSDSIHKYNVYKK